LTIDKFNSIIKKHFEMRKIFFLLPLLFFITSLGVCSRGIHIVEVGQTLYSISKLYNVSLEELIKVNNLTSNLIKPGDRLIIPPPSFQQEEESPSFQQEEESPSFQQEEESKVVQNSPAIQSFPTITQKYNYKRPIIIVIDPGHGGKDPGAVRRYPDFYIKEKDINLDIAKRLKRVIEQRIENAIVYLTRNDDRFLPLSTRTKFANDKKADMFISIHSNAAYRSIAHGFEVYYLSVEATNSDARALACIENQVLEKYEGKKLNDLVNFILADLAQHKFIEESIKLGCYVNEAVVKELEVKNRGVKGALFYVLKDALMPAILIETGFISNYAEVNRLMSPVYKERLVQAICAGICQYLNDKGS
jgi:N-acetylmuramoyl-L-alanine amidase